MRLGPKLGLLRWSIVANAALAVAILIDRFLHSNGTYFGPTSISDWASYTAYVVGMAGLFFDKAWGRAAYGVFLVISIAQEGDSDTTQLQNLLYDLDNLSCGVLIARAFFVTVDPASADRAKANHLQRTVKLQIELRSLLQTMRMCLGVNFAIMVGLFFDGFLSSDGTLRMPKTFGEFLIQTWPLPYVAAVVGLWFGQNWARLAFCFFLIFILIVGEWGYMTRLTDVFLDLFFQSSGVILVFLTKRNIVGSADRPAIGDVFS